MREIKFRGLARTTNGKRWVYGYLYKVKSFFNNRYQYFIRNEHLQDFAVDEETIGQYTGLKDKNGKEIYEGDIFNLKDSKILYIVEWFDTALSGRQNGNNSRVGLQYWQTKIEVIGNIHDNPEMLKEV